MSKVNYQGKKVAVIGSRTFKDKERLYRILNLNREKIKLIVSGGAKGADTLATQWASDYGVPYLVFPAMWHNPDTGEFDRGAGFRRNVSIVKHSDIVLAFWDGESGGTKHSLEIAEQQKKPVRIFKFTPVLETSEKASSTPNENTTTSSPQGESPL